MKQAHIIKKQVLEVTYPDKKQAVDGQNTLSALYRQELADMIEKVFEEVSGYSGPMRLDILEINLGVLDGENFHDSLKNALRIELKHELFEKAGERKNRYPSPNKQARFNKESKQNRQQTDSNAERAGQRERHQIQSMLELFTFYVETGQLPWWAYKEGFTSLDELAGSLLEKNRSGFLDLVEGLLRYPTERKRLICQLSDQHLISILGGISEVSFNGNELQMLLNDLAILQRELRLLPESKMNFRNRLWDELFTFFRSESSHLQKTARAKHEAFRWLDQITGTKVQVPESNGRTTDVLLFLLFRISKAGREFGSLSSSVKRSELSQTLGPLQHILIDLINLGISSPDLDHPVLKFLSGIGESHAKRKIKIEKNIHKRDERAFDELEETLKKIESSAEEAKSHRSKTRVQEEELEINNAGLVIIAPFLSQLFNQLGLVDEKEFITEEAAKRAVLILQYLVTKKLEFPEHELSLNKLLCGVALDEPIAREITISEFEKKELNDLMESVLEHWTALKGTSAEGVRITFFNKTGILAPQNEHWKLTVERDTVDILLDKLPWGISIIKLPWMKHMIHVEW